MSFLNPTSSGKLYTMNTLDFNANVVPTTPLHDSHAFCALWQSFLASLTNGCDSFWDPMLRIYTGQTDFLGNQTEREQIKEIFLKNPPNIIIADMQSQTLYGCHKRLPCLWTYIFISKCYVDKWVTAQDQGNTAVEMGYEALLKATLVHESAHWAQTLRVGLCTVDLTQDQVDNPPLANLEQLRLKKKMTPKSFETFLAPNASGEAGYYVELAVFGGVLSIGDCDKLIIANSNIYLNTAVSIHALRELKNLGLCQLISPSLAASEPLTPQLPLPTPILNCQEVSSMLSDSDDEDDLSLLFHCPREYPVLDRIAATWFRDSHWSELVADPDM